MNRAEGTVFLTGASGFIGGAVAGELARRGYRVVGLARSAESARAVEAAGASPHEGDLLEPDSYRREAVAADAVIHAAFDYGSPEEGDRVALDALLAATAESGAPFLYTSGCWVVGDTGGRPAGDDVPTDHPAPLVAWRVPHERRVIAGSKVGRPAAVVRPGIVYGREGGLTARLFETALESGAAEYVGDGKNHWSMIHVSDLARLCADVLAARAAGVVQAVDGLPLRVREVAQAASRAAGADGATLSVPVEVARERMGPVADAVCLDQELIAPGARALGWRPERASFTEAAERAFEEWKEAVD